VYRGFRVDLPTDAQGLAHVCRMCWKLPTVLVVRFDGLVAERVFPDHGADFGGDGEEGRVSRVLCGAAGS
jgi:hypothetical protein